MSREAQPAHRSRTSRRKPIVFAGGILFGALLWFAPTLLLQSPLKQPLIEAATANLPGQINIRNMSTGWLSPVVIHELEAVDEQGQPLVHVTSVQTEKSLLALLMDSSRLGTIRIINPRIAIVTRPDGSNLEDALAPFLNAPATESSGMSLKVEVVDGEVNVTDSETGAQWQAQKVNLLVEVEHDAPQTIAGQLQMQIVDQRGAGSLAAQVGWEQPVDEATDPWGQGRLLLKTERVPLAIAQPLLRRWEPDLELAGDLHAEVHLNWSAAGHDLKIQQLKGEQVAVSAPRWLSTDRFVASQVSFNASLSSAWPSWQIESINLTSDVAQVDLRGNGSSASVPAPADSFVHWLQAIQHGNMQAHGTLDLAAIARLFPQTLHLRQGAEISSGTVSFTATADSSSGAQRWQGELQTSDIAAMLRGQQHIWKSPLQMNLVAHTANQSLEIQELLCKTSFLDVNAQGNRRQGSLTAQGDLQRLLAEIGPFVDVGSLSCAGQLAADLKWSQDASGHFGLHGRAKAERFELATDGGQPWREERLLLSVDAGGLANANSLLRIDQGSVRCESGTDLLQATLAATVAPVSLRSTWPCRVEMTGDLRTWAPRLRPFVPLAGTSLAGQIDMKLLATAEGDRLSIGESAVRIDNLQFDNETLHVHEPAVQMSMSGSWDQESQQLTTEAMTLASSSVALRADGLTVRLGEAQTNVSGDIGYRCDLERLYSWMSDPAIPAAQKLNGNTTGRLKFNATGPTTEAEMTMEVREFAVLHRTEPLSDTALGQTPIWSTLWSEPQLNLMGHGSYDSVKDQIQLGRVELGGETISLGVKGTISQVSQQALVDVAGQLGYDLELLVTKLGPELREGIEITGRGTKPFTFRGPLLAVTTTAEPRGLRVNPVSTRPEPNLGTSALEGLFAQASLDWTSASIQGVTIGPGEMDSQLSSGVVKVAPLDLSVSEGRLRRAPEISLNQEPMRLQLPGGGQVDNVRISPAMCRTWLKYVAPLMADATAADGRFSVTLNKTDIPLDQPSSGEVQGSFTIHSAQIGPGPLARELLQLAQQVKAIVERRVPSNQPINTSQWLALPEQHVAFHLVNNRVHHQGMQIMVQDVAIRTSGSVGFDQTISMTAEIPIRDEWVSRDKYLATLRGQTIQIPIRGNLTRPRLDTNRLNELARQMVTGAASGLLQQELNRGLQRLFPQQP